MYNSPRRDAAFRLRIILLIMSVIVFVVILLIEAPNRIHRVSGEAEPRISGEVGKELGSPGKDDKQTPTLFEKRKFSNPGFNKEKTGKSVEETRLSGNNSERRNTTLSEEHSKMRNVPSDRIIEKYAPGKVPSGSIHFSFQDTVKRDDSIYSILRNFGVSPVEIIMVNKAAQPVFNFRKIKKGQVVECILDRNGELDLFGFRISEDSLLVVEPVQNTGENVFQAEIIIIPIETEEVPLTIDIETSLWNAVLSSGEKPALALMIAEIFQWQVDFLVDIKGGERIGLIVQKRYDNGDYIGYGKILAAEFRGDAGEFDAFYFKDPEGNSGYYDAEGHAVRKMFLKSPLNYTRISSRFSYGRMHPILHRRMPHLGVDYAAPYGTPVSSSADGVVVFAGRKGPNGNMVEIRHNSVYTTYYLHLSGFARGIRRGRKVGQGQVIGYVGATGRATGPHLDYRIKRYGSFINPLTAEFPSGEPVNEQYIAEFIKKRDQMLAALPKPPSRIRIANSSRKDDTVKVSNNRTDG